VENKGTTGQTPGIHEIVTTGPAGTVVTSAPETASGAAVISAAAVGAAAGPGAARAIESSTVSTLQAGQTAVLTTEHPKDKPTEAVIIEKKFVSSSSPEAKVWHFPSKNRFRIEEKIPSQ